MPRRGEVEAGHEVPSCLRPHPPLLPGLSCDGALLPHRLPGEESGCAEQDILVLVHSSQNKFLWRYSGLESKESRRGPGTTVRVKAGSQQFKVGSGWPCLPGVWGQIGMERPAA